jgi:hypothetical protein
MTIPSTPIPTPDPDPAIAEVSDLARVVITGHAARSIAELLELCDQFWRTHPMGRGQLQAFLDAQPDSPPADWLIDMLGFNALYLQAKLAAASAGPGTHAAAEPGNTGDSR